MTSTKSPYICNFRVSRWCGAVALAAWLSAACVPLQAGVVTSGNLNYSAARTSPATVDARNSTTFAGVTFFSDFLFNPTGTWDVANTSRLQAQFADQLSAPGFATIQLGQIGVSSSFNNSIGINGEIGATALGVTISEEWGLGLRTSRTGTGSLASISDSDNDLADPAPSLGIPFALEATAGVRADLTTNVDFATLSGSLEFRNRENGVTGRRPFLLSSSDLWTFNIFLPVAGIYDFSLLETTLVGTLSNTTTFSISIFGTVFGNDTDDIRLPFSPNTTHTSFSSTVGGINNWFSIEVAEPAPPPGDPVPEPASIAIAVQGGIAALFALRRRRRNRQGLAASI